MTSSFTKYIFLYRGLGEYDFATADGVGGVLCSKLDPYDLLIFFNGLYNDYPWVRNLPTQFEFRARNWLHNSIYMIDFTLTDRENYARCIRQFYKREVNE